MLLCTLDVVMVSIAGGLRDTLIRSDLCSLHKLDPNQQEQSNSRSITASTYSMANVYLSTDHQVLWKCKGCTANVLEIVYCVVQPSREEYNNSAVFFS
jgi:hypothetical protein